MIVIDGIPVYVVNTYTLCAYSLKETKDMWYPSMRQNIYLHSEKHTKKLIFIDVLYSKVTVSKFNSDLIECVRMFRITEVTIDVSMIEKCILFIL